MTSDNDIPDDEKNLFRNTMRDVKPLQNKAKNLYKEPKAMTFRKKLIPKENPPPIHIENKYQLVGSEEVIFFTRNGISKKQLLDLKNARNRYESVLDLHGLSPDNAAIQLSNFINRQYNLNKKIILVIHGKSGRDNTPPVIKNLVNSYLRQIPEVLAFYSAMPKDGGTGAVYVLLRKLM